MDDRKSTTTTLSNSIYKTIQKVGLDLNRPANQLIEEGMLMALNKYKDDVDQSTKEKIEELI